MRYETYEVDNRRVIINYEDRYIYLINGVYIYIFLLLIRTNVYIYILYIKTMYAWGCKA